MSGNAPSALQAGFWLTRQERLFVLTVCSLLLLGMAVRFFYLKNRTPEGYEPAGNESVEMK